MKKIIFAICFLFIGLLGAQIFAQSAAFADEIIDAQGNIIPCKIETVEDGFIEYYKDGNLHTFTREENSPVFNDYVDVRVKLLKKDSVIRHSGKILVKDMWSVIMQNENGQMDIPWYRVKFVGVYKPE